MRLSQSEITNIITSIEPFIAKTTAELRLYGSRVNDKARGGDIDLLLIVDTAEEKTKLIRQKPEILVAIKKSIGERRIDLKISAQNETTTDPFLQVVMPTSVLLHAFLWQNWYD